MVKLITPVLAGKSPVQCSLQDRILVLGSCFADAIGTRLTDGGFKVCVNPFGTLYNPSSIASALEILSTDTLFGPEDCVQMGAGSQRICSFRHHTSFSRTTGEEFLEHANAALMQAREFWKQCNKVIITFGTAFVWEHEKAGIVANCLKRNASEFTHRMLGVQECRQYMERISQICAGRGIIFTISPIRHLSLGAHSNTLSKATLHLALDAAQTAETAYFPAYEIVCDELRDYRFYAEDLVHPSKTAEEIVWERFMGACVPPEEHQEIARTFKEGKRGRHISITAQGQ